MAAAGRRLGTEFRLKPNKKAWFESDTGERLCVLYSSHKPDTKKRGVAYWPTLLEKQKPFLAKGGDDAYLVLACEGLPQTYLLPYRTVVNWVGASMKPAQWFYLAQDFENATGRYEGWSVHFDSNHTQATCHLLESYELPLNPPSEQEVVDKKPGRTIGFVPTDIPSLVQYERNAPGPCFTYAMRFGKRNVWKIGLTKDPQRRERDANSFVPHEVLDECWSIAYQRKHATGTKAWKMEQAILKAAEAKFPGKVLGERVQCTKQELKQLWDAV